MMDRRYIVKTIAAASFLGTLSLAGVAQAQSAAPQAKPETSAPQTTAPAESNKSKAKSWFRDRLRRAIGGGEGETKASTDTAAAKTPASAAPVASTHENRYPPTSNTSSGTAPKTVPPKTTGPKRAIPTLAGPRLGAPASPGEKGGTGNGPKRNTPHRSRSRNRGNGAIEMGSKGVSAAD